ncbi:MAG: NUMOD3 domain-containing DNA-binding protein [Nanoarchaeota archaeon]
MQLSEKQKNYLYSEKNLDRLKVAQLNSIPWNKGKHHSEETKQKLREHHWSKTGKIRRILRIKSAWNKGLTKETDERVRKYAIKIKENFKNPEFKEKMIKKMMIGEHKKPNKTELQFIELIQQNNFPFKYIGNWEFVLGGKCPDFININGQKQLIELFGNYWHTVKARETPEERIQYFKKYGFDTLIIWESELKNENKLIEKIRQFINN